MPRDHFRAGPQIFLPVYLEQLQTHENWIHLPDHEQMRDLLHQPLLYLMANWRL
jgi:hypothetical protein